MQSFIRTVLRSVMGRNRKNSIDRISSVSTSSMDFSLATDGELGTACSSDMWTVSQSRLASQSAERAHRSVEFGGPESYA
ncbi:hypothetical protein GCM10010987_70940 [Bradyrhizobium guangdongense]|uniref:Uncharacterized protein n=1 Tax=Bradyrhizobium guangdongense TaxID=1325090 RepID=A0AA88BAG6_9BRAD|nr:hypothetical protein GCM10010987_70940 [Bradyrhizobium guangdongense]